MPGQESASAVTADVVSVDRLFKRRGGVLYSQWRTLLLLKKLGGELQEGADRRRDYSEWRSQLLSVQPGVAR